MEKHIIDFFILVQKFIAKGVKIEHLGIENVKVSCAADVSYYGEKGFAVAVKKDGERVEYNIFEGKVGFPYISGLLYVREAPLIIRALEPYECDLILIDAHGLSHPRKAGLTTIIGVLLDKPSIGVAKSRLSGKIIEENGEKFIVVDGEKVGVVKGKYYFSIGNKVDLRDVIELSSFGYPELLRMADMISKKAKNLKS